MRGGEHKFWYFAFTDGQTGYLLDLIQRPAEAVARLAVFRHDKLPRVLRERFPLEALIERENAVALGSWLLDQSRCAGHMDGISLDCAFRLLGSEVTLVPPWLAKRLPRIPLFRSTPGTIQRALAEGQLFQGIPCIYSRYRVTDMDRARWFLISAHGFDDDTRCEISAGRLLGRWAVSGYIRLGHDTHELTSPLANLFRFRVQSAGQKVQGERRFAVSYHSAHLQLRLVAWAKDKAFARLEREGCTTIHTTLFGNCRLEIATPGKSRSLIATSTCLLEVKEHDVTSAATSHRRRRSSEQATRQR